MPQAIKKLVTHDGSFHTDDIFAAATLTIYLEKMGEAYEIVRTRDEEIIKTGDYVFDVGGVYDAEKNKFDHHQKGGAGKYDNGIEYASIGLVWKKFGEELCGSKEEAEIIEKKLVCPIDAGDNGMSLVEFKTDIKPYFIQTLFSSFYPDWKNLNDENLRTGFLQCVNIARNVLANEITQAKEKFEAKEQILKIYENTKDKRILVLDQKYPYEDITGSLLEPVFVVYPRADGFWAAKCEKSDRSSFSRKKDFPSAWAGLRDEDLQKVSGVSDAVFCHRALFMAVAKSQEGAIKLAQIALES